MNDAPENNTNSGIFAPAEIRDVVGSEDSFGHEMRVGGAIRRVRAFSALHGGTYTDPVTGKPRQFDYRCALDLDHTSLRLAVECKSLSKSVAVAVCGTARRNNEGFHEFIESRKAKPSDGTTIRLRGWTSLRLHATQDGSYYPVGEFVGKSLVRIVLDDRGDKKEQRRLSRTKDSDIYDSWEQALSSAVDLAHAACSSVMRLSVDASFTAILPVVVVPDDRLWRVIYDDSGNISADPNQVTECTLYVGKQIEVGPVGETHPFIFSHVHFFTLAGFESFLSKMVVNRYAWDRLLTHKAMEMSSDLQG